MEGLEPYVLSIVTGTNQLPNVVCAGISFVHDLEGDSTEVLLEIFNGE